ncbi:hypothetical protein [Trinickia violacea]|uniref:hypothetical protein n=1 Tax=Trinickia violacea TaxID=2571746 RepID=UPI0015862706|nr:hypothetical protein [Trinickia violacea]
MESQPLAKFYPYSSNPHRGIEQSWPVPADVIKVAIEAREADRWFGERQATSRLKQLFPNAIEFLIQDDYLADRQKASIEDELAPAKVTWDPGFCIDGRHGR